MIVLLFAYTLVSLPLKLKGVHTIIINISKATNQCPRMGCETNILLQNVVIQSRLSERCVPVSKFKAWLVT